MCCYLVWSARLLPKEYPYAAKAAALEEDGVVFLTEMKQTNMKQNNGKKTTHRPCHDANNPVNSVAYEDKDGKTAASTDSPPHRDGEDCELV